MGLDVEPTCLTAMGTLRLALDYQDISQRVSPSASATTPSRGPVNAIEVECRSRGIDVRVT